MPEFVTIGAHGWDAERFFSALLAAGVDTFCDLRARRGVRGREYAFANSQRLQARLAELGIRYIHRLDLAPSAATRSQQHAADEATHTAKRSACDRSVRRSSSRISANAWPASTAPGSWPTSARTRAWSRCSALSGSRRPATALCSRNV